MIMMSFATGSVYCWTLFREDIAEHSAAFTPFILTLCFMLALFCLGMTAAFGGKIVERSVKRASLYTFIFFTAGWLITAVGIHIGGTAGVVLAVIGFGPVQGIGLGLGYLTPVKTLMMWFDKRKGFAAGVSIAAFGLAGLIGNPLIGVLLQNISVYNAFYILTAIYGVLCFVSWIVIDRPELKQQEQAVRVLRVKEVVFTKKFIFLWLVLFLNIAAGLALMSHEQQIYIMLGLNVEDHRMLIVALCMITAGGGNLIGRLVCGAIQDKTPKKHFPYYIMTIASLAVSAVGLSVIFGAPHWVVGFIAIFFIQFFFGFGFAGLPGILHKSYGMKQLSTIQGYMLTAWAIAAIVGPLVAMGVLDLPYANRTTYYNTNTISWLFIILAIMFAVQLVFLFLFAILAKKEKNLTLEESTDGKTVILDETTASDETVALDEATVANDVVAISDVETTIETEATGELAT